MEKAKEAVPMDVDEAAWRDLEDMKGIAAILGWATQLADSPDFVSVEEFQSVANLIIHTTRRLDVSVNRLRASRNTKATAA